MTEQTIADLRRTYARLEEQWLNVDNGDVRTQQRLADAMDKIDDQIAAAVEGQEVA